MKRFLKLLGKSFQGWARTSRSFLSDGLLILLMKAVFFLAFIYHTIVFIPVVFLLGGPAWVIARVCLFCHLCRRSEHTEANLPKQVYRLATDLYMLVMSGVLVYCFHVAYTDGSQPERGHEWSNSLIVVVAISAVRVYEILSAVARFHTRRQYLTHYPMKVLVNTLWHYGEITLAFATFYVAASVAGSDTFKADNAEFLKSWATPLYFSFVTITTLGYGDYSPVTNEGKALVVCQVLFGVVLLIVALQRVLSSKSPPDRSKNKSASRRTGEGNDGR